MAKIWNREFPSSGLQTLFQGSESCIKMNNAAIQGDDDMQDEHVKGTSKGSLIPVTP
jgi:hypothetical protein